MNRKKAFYILMIFWFLIIGAYTAYKEYCLKAGEEVFLRVAPVDPRDIFRGDYVIFNYEISSVSKEQKILDRSSIYSEEESFYPGETVYVMLVEDGKYHKGGDISKTKPGKGLFIKGKIETNQRFFGLIDRNNVSIIYGIENFFVPEGEGKEIESARNRNKVSVKIAVNKYGSASVKELYIDDKKADFKNKDEKIH